MPKKNQTTPTKPGEQSGLAEPTLLACPWCHSTKIMAEGNGGGKGRVLAMVCQRCGARGPEDRNANGYATIARMNWNNQYWHDEIKRLITNSNRDSRIADVARDDLATTMMELKIEKDRNAEIVKLVGKKKLLKMWRDRKQAND